MSFNRHTESDPLRQTCVMRRHAELDAELDAAVAGRRLIAEAKRNAALADASPLRRTALARLCAALGRYRR